MLLKLSIGHNRTKGLNIIIVALVQPKEILYHG